MKRNPTILLALAVVALAAAPLRAQVDNPPPDATTAPPPRPAIFTLTQVEIMPELANRSEVARLITRHYPREMRRRRETGSVTLEFVVSADGTVDSTTITPLNASDTAFVAGGVKVVRGMRFQPGQFDGRAVPVRVILPVLFWMEPRPAPAPWTPGSRPR